MADPNYPLDLSGTVGVLEENYFSAGGFSTVWRGRWIDPGRRHPNSPPNAVLAIKAFSGSRLPDFAETFDRRMRRETKNWHRMDHPNILPLYGICYQKIGHIPDFPALVSPYLPEGNIKGFIERNPQVNRMNLIHQIARGLIYLHSVGFVHGDLKGSNVLIKNDWQACLCDFGRTVLAGSDDFSKSLIASAHWAAPELLNAPDDSAIPITRASDAWAFGMVAIEVLTGHLPWGRTRDVIVLQLVVNRVRPDRANYAEVEDAVWDAIWPCWRFEASRRPSVAHVAQVLPTN